jgi:uncharacterized peroxidase-related enzyme
MNMQRIKAINPKTAPERTKALLNEVQKTDGTISNMMSAMANSPAALEGYLRFSDALASGTLSARLREQIALAVAEVNASQYCISLHTAGAKFFGLSEDDLTACRRFTSTDPKEEAALQFAFRVVMTRGEASARDIERVRQAGFSDAVIVEIIANVVLNIFANYFNKVAGVVDDSLRRKSGR